MKTLLKVVLACIVVVAVLVGGALAYLMFALDPNSYKPQLEEAARKQGLELDIAGDLGWSLWPNLAITAGEIRFAGEQYGLHPSSVQQANLALAWRELLSKRIAVKALAIDGADLHLADLSSGAAIAVTPATGSQPVEATSDAGQAFSLAVDKLAITNSRLRLDQEDGYLQLSDIDFDTSGVRLDGSSFPLSLDFTHRLDDYQELTVKIRATASYDLDAERATVRDSRIEVAGLLPETLRLSMKGHVDLATETAQFQELVADLGSSSLSGDATLNYREPLSLRLALKGTALHLDKLLADESFEGLTLSNPILHLDMRNNIITVKELSAGLFSGHFQTQAVVDSSQATPSLRFNASLEGIDLAAALDQFADDVDLAGTLTMTLEGSSRGLDADALLANMNARGELQVADLLLGNINVEQSYCELAALVERSGKRKEPWPKGTRLNDLVSHYRLVGPILHLDDYSTGMGNIELRGDGQIDLDRERFDIRAITRLNGERTSEQGCEVKSSRVRDKDVPFVCKDSFAKAGPSSCTPDPAFVREILQKELFDRLGGDDTEEGSSLEDRLRGLLGR